MARFYQTSQPNFLADKMLELPYDLMSQVVLNADKNIDETLDTATGLYGKLEANALQQDRPRLQNIVKGYEESIDQLVNDIQKDPLAYSKKIGDIRALGRKVNTDFTTGEVAAIEERYNRDQQWWKEAKELQKKDPDLYDDDYLRRVRQANLAQSGEISYNGPNDYNTYVENSVYGLGNMNEWVDARLKDAVPDAESIERDTVQGGWIVTTKSGSKRMTAGELNDILQSSFNADKNLQSALLQREQLGIPGFEGISRNGEILPVSGTEEIEIVGEDGKMVRVPSLTYSPNIVGQAFSAGVRKFGFEEFESSRSLKADPYGLKRQDLADRKAYKEWSDNKQDDFLQYTTNNTIKSVAGSNAQEYSRNIAFTQKKMDDIRNGARDIIRRELGIPSEGDIPMEAEVALHKGNFSYLYGLKNPDGTDMFRSGAIDRLKDSFREEQLNMAGIQAVRSDWEKQMEARHSSDPKGLTLEEYLDANEPDFNRYLNENSTITTNQNFTWEGTGVTPAEAKNFSKQLVDSGMYRLYEIDFPQGTIATDKNGAEVDLAGMSLDQMLRKGLVEREPVKVPYQAKVPGMVDADGNPLPGEAGRDTYEMRYRMVDGSGYIGFSVAPESIAPATSYDDDRNLELGMVVDFRGEKRIAKIDDVTSTKLKGFENMNKDLLNANYYLQKLSNASEVTLPGGQGVKIRNDRSTGTLRQYLVIPNGRGGEITEPLTPEMKRKVLIPILKQ